ncbi:DNA-3-methyladenine glycosylase 2 family protein [Planosporangium flavigriseum]|uniref:DNA-3-methyladenine glycosylase 2 family protein n=1 Tax=Planosporangium flavigriseum TaxID=373681 RepID=UPI00143A6A4A|nr:AlkA N-terminal domain-containing protein [Planosporangium flavigriseum]NJC63441.1 DNA-3-methyladenine glycosylase 2 family protein [Planosporangium flavigriseum]
MELDFERCYRAVDSRDPRFDGWFVTAVTSTRIYCRPSCPAVTPKRHNVRFLPSPAAAQREGFRACLRCRPDAAPGSPEWDNRADVVARAMRLIGDGVVDRDGVPGLASRLGYTERHLHRMLHAELGAGPLALARAQRAQTARILISTTDLGLAEIAFAAGFRSVRQFNETIKDVYGRAPSALRSSSTRAGAPGAITLRLPYRAPLHADALFGFLAARAIPGVEIADDNGYHRTLRLPHGRATATLAPRDGYVQATLHLTDIRDVAPAVARCRRLLDLDADPEAVDAALATDPALTSTVRDEPGVRLPRAVDGFELAVRAIVGQQVSVAAARTVLAKLVLGCSPVAQEGAPHGTCTPTGAPSRKTPSAGAPSRKTPTTAAPSSGALRLFPDAAAVSEAPDDAFAMPAARRRTIRALATAVTSGNLVLDDGADRAETEKKLLELPGVGSWTAGYVALRALGDPDVFLPTDLGARRGAAVLGLSDDPTELARHATRWRPWRSYALIRLWRLA